MKKQQKNKQSDNTLTKDYFDKRLDERFDKYNKNLMKYLNLRFEPFEEMRKDFYSFKDSVLKSLDWLVKAFNKFNDEHTILTGRFQT